MHLSSCEQEFDVTFCIPCLNEEPHIASTLQKVVTASQVTGRTCEILVVDDGSTDGTSERVRQFQTEHPATTISLVRNERTRGVGYAFLEGAIRGRGRYYRWLTGDDSESLDSTITTLRAMGSADLVIPYYTFTGRTAARLLLSRAYVALVNSLSGQHLRYYHGGYIVPRDLVVRWFPKGSGLGTHAEFLTTLLAEGFSYVEVRCRSVTHETNVSSGLRPRSIIVVGNSLLQIVLRRLKLF